MASTMIPIPPSQCVTERHNRMPSGSPSTSVNTVAPVVVKPDIASKIAAMTPSTVPEIRKGRAPNTAVAVQAKVTMA